MWQIVLTNTFSLFSTAEMILWYLFYKKLPILLKVKGYIIHMQTLYVDAKTPKKLSITNHQRINLKWMFKSDVCFSVNRNPILIALQYHSNY